MTRMPTTAALLVALLLLPTGVTGCGETPAAKPQGGTVGATATNDGGVATSGIEAPLKLDLETWKDAPPTRLRFEDVSAQSGIDQVNHSGRKGVKEFLIEAVGPGPAWLDYDKDGLLDIYIPEGDVFSNYDLMFIPDPEKPGRRRPVLERKKDTEEEFLDRLWRNNGDGTFTDVTKQAGIHEPLWSFGATAVDYNADGWTDIYVSNFGKNRLWKNNGDGTFTDVAESVGVAGHPYEWSTCAAVGDIDGDDRIDFYVAAYADPAHEVNRQREKRGLEVSGPVTAVTGRDCQWRGIKAYCGPRGLRGQQDRVYIQYLEGQFEERSEALGMVPRGTPKYGFTTLLFDLDEDGLTDVYVANDSEENFLWYQALDADGNATFRDRSDTLGVKYGYNLTAQASMGMCLADINGDGLFDIFITNFSHDYNNMFLGHRVKQSGSFYYKDRGLKVMGQPVFYDLSWGCGFVDFDNDGDLDLYFANGHVYKEIDIFEKTGAEYEQYNALFECMDAKKLGYREVGASAMAHLEDEAQRKKVDAGPGMEVKYCSRAVAFADIDNDGDMDAIVGNMNERPTVLLNTSAGARERGWIKFQLEQPGGNREALGAVIEVRAGDKLWRKPVVRHESFLGSNDPRIHVGLGEGIQEVQVSVIWPGRKRERTDFGTLSVGGLYRLDKASGKAEAQTLRTFEITPAKK